MTFAYKAVAFDMDGTLLDSMLQWHSLGVEYLARKGRAVPEGMRDYLHMSCHACARVICETYEPERDIEDMYLELESGMAAHYATDVIEKRAVCALLAPLKARGVRLCVATWTPRRYAQPALERFGLMRFFEDTVCGDELNVGKDDPEYFIRLCRRLRLPPESVMMAEDSLYAARAAKRAGLGVCAVRDERLTQREADELQAMRDANPEELLASLLG